MSTPISLRTRRPESAESDADLVRRLTEGDLSALGALYDRHHESVRQFVSRATNGDADADDLAHETFLTLPKIAQKYDGRASARPFLLGVAAQLVRRRRRGVARWLATLEARARGALDRPVATPEEAAGLAEEMTSFERALARLSEDKRITFLLVEAEGLSGQEVAEQLGIPLNTVWTRLHHARLELRRALGATSKP